jgi:hypothetical protein
VSEWHVPEEMLSRFSSSPGGVDDVTAASIEQHVTVCGSCQAGLARLAAAPQLDAIWAGVEDRVDRSGARATERLLQRLGVESGSARLIAATPALRMGALGAVGLIVAAVVLATRVDIGSDAFLVVAPLVPTVLVALSFAPGADPAGECGLATPVYGFGLVMRRTVGIEIVALGALAVGSLFVPIDGLRVLGWLLPALALSLATVAGSVRWTAPEMATGLAAAWLAAIALATVAQRGGAVADSAVFDAAGQLVVAVVAVVACVVVAANRQVVFQEVSR